MKGVKRVIGGSSISASGGPAPRGRAAGPAADRALPAGTALRADTGLPADVALPADAAPPANVAPPSALHRSGAVARMLGMPVATLRVWERRYALTRAPASAGGQRRYTAADVHRLMLVRQLTGLGYAIGSLAALDLGQLRDVAATHARTRARVHHAAASAGAASRALRLAVVGRVLAGRLGRPALLRRLGRPLALLGPFEDASQAQAALAAPGAGPAPDAALLHEPHLHPGWLESLRARAPALAGLPLGVVFGYASDPACEALADGEVALLREPQPDVVLAHWLGHWAWQASGPGRVPAASAQAAAGDPAPPRRWDDAALADFAARASAVACECPRHVAELLLQLTGFEAYSAQCAHRTPPDAELHARLGRVAGHARSGFEDALAEVAMHEGVALPSSVRRPAGP
jgi:DNA-binding transcriptional MerR regulator